MCRALVRVSFGPPDVDGPGRLVPVLSLPRKPRRAQDQELLLRVYRSHFACLRDVLLGYRQTEPSARHIIASRYHFGRALLRYGIENRVYALWLKGVVTQMLRDLAGVFAVWFGGAERILRRRSEEPDEAQRNEWLECRRFICLDEIATRSK